MHLHWTKAEIAGWIIALLGITGMGILVFTGPYHNINKTQAQSVRTAAVVKILTAPPSQAQLIGIYTPHSITVHVGQAVVFSNLSNAAHTVTEDHNLFNSNNIERGGASWTYFPTRAGTFHYYCEYHQFMHGILVVQP